MATAHRYPRYIGYIYGTTCNHLKLLLANRAIRKFKLDPNAKEFNPLNFDTAPATAHVVTTRASPVSPDSASVQAATSYSVLYISTQQGIPPSSDSHSEMKSPLFIG